MSRFLFPFTVILIVSVNVGAQTTPGKSAKPVQFDSDVSPIFRSSCNSCHGESAKLKDLDLSTEQSAVKGSSSGPVVVPGKPDESLLY